jgi:hypothetical protein
MKTMNPLLSRLLQKAMKPRNTVLVAMKNRRGGAGAHRKTHGAQRRAEHVAVQQELAHLDHEEDDHA